MTVLANQHVQQAQNFFADLTPKSKRVLGAEASADPQGADNVPQMFQPNGNTTGSVIRFIGALPDSVTDQQRKDFGALINTQQIYLQQGLGLVTSWLTQTYGSQPTQWANPVNWDTPLSALPPVFYTKTELTEYHFSQSMRGVEVATSFLGTLVSWASGVGIAATFSKFLGTIGDQIRAGTQSKGTSMDTYHLSFSYQPIQDSAGNWQLISLADYYFISFTESQKTIYSSCASAQTYDFDFHYQKGTILLNWAPLNASLNAVAKANWDGVLGNGSADDVSRAANFFTSPAKAK